MGVLQRSRLDRDDLELTSPAQKLLRRKGLIFLVDDRRVAARGLQVVYGILRWGTTNRISPMAFPHRHASSALNNGARSFQDGWRLLCSGEPGNRFRRLHELREQHRQNVELSSIWMLVGLIMLCLGIILLVFPGPGFLVMAAGAILVARESRPAACFFDRCELYCREVAQRCRP